MTVARAYEVDASSMCDVLSGVPGVEDVSLQFDSRGNGVLRVRLRAEVDEDAVVGAAVAALHRRFGVGLEGGRLRLTGPSGRTVVAVVEPHRPPQQRRRYEPPPLDAPAAQVPGREGPGREVPGLADEPPRPPSPERRSLDSWRELTAPKSMPPRERAPLDGAGSFGAGSFGAVPLDGVVPGLAQPPDLAPDDHAQEHSPAGMQEHSPERMPEHSSDEGHEDDQETRLVLDQVEVATGRLELWATVRLRTGEVVHTGTASATATGSGANRAVVAATARAAESALGGALRLDVEAVDLLGVGADQVGVVIVTLLTERGVDRVTGAALVRGDGRETLVRATLDALNRRTEGRHRGRDTPSA
ncbi:MAG TPA: hypothetical protein VFL94_13380 [Actinomycetales bacterium]|nr:hypothetical protein [Actinomycetales bacterium]